MESRRTIGQYYTPIRVVRFMFDLSGMRPGWKVIDPCCGQGAFLAEAILRGASKVVGVEIDETAAAAAEQIGALVFRQDGLRDIEGPLDLRGGYDLAIGNPPFAFSHHRVRDPEILRRFHLAYGRFHIREALFLERFIQLVREGGRVCIILPEGIFTNLRLRPFRKELTCRYTIRAVIGLPAQTFMSAGTTARTKIMLLDKMHPGEDHRVLLAEIKAADLQAGRLGQELLRLAGS